MDPFIAQIIMFAGNFAPRGWAFCDGQLLPISQNTALFSLIGTIYGGDGRTTFALPDLRGRAPIHAGTGSGLSIVKLGSKVGTETNTLSIAQMPSHNHEATSTADLKLATSTEAGEESTPANQFLASGNNIYIDSATANTYLGGLSGSVNTTIGNSGQNQAVNNIQPSLGMNYIIALVGNFPSRS